jgi:type I restriction enzyme S subunit
VPATLNRFRQAVLAAACSGRLTADWREKNPTVVPANTLLERISKEIEQQVLTRARRKTTALTKVNGSGVLNDNGNGWELPGTWSWTELGRIVVNHDSRRVPVKQSDRDGRHGPYPYYGAFGIIDHIDDFLFDGEFLLVAEDGKNLESRLRPIALRANGQFWVNNHAHVLQTRGGISLEYLEAYLNSSKLNLTPFLTGIDQVKLNREAMDTIPIALPPVAEQREIVRRVGELFAVADAVEGKLAAARRRVEGLTQAVLAKAFRGELVPTEAELARRDGRDYEPASALLARIRAEREQATATPRLKRGRRATP